MNDQQLREAEQLLKQELSIITLKSVNEVLREYQDTLERYVVNVVNGNMTKGEMSRAMRALIKRLAPNAYTEGMREGGIRDPEAEMEDEDDEAIATWAADQLLYVDGFTESCQEASTLKGDDRTTQRDILLNRVDDWVSSMRFIGQKGYLSAKGNLPLTMKGTDGKVSCNECQKYKNQRHRMSWWDKRGLLDRPNENYTCGRFDTCQHHFYDDDDNIVID